MERAAGQACTIPTRTYPDGRTGTVAGYNAHWKADEQACRECLAAGAAYRRRYPDHNLRARHGMTREQYDAILASQGGRCAVCGTTAAGGRGRFHVDHDHACCPSQRSCAKCVRGLLCARCNYRIREFNEDAELLAAAAAYLRRS